MRSTTRREGTSAPTHLWVVLGLCLVATLGCAGDGEMGGPVSCAIAPSVPEIMLPESTTDGILKGESHNRSTTCTGDQGTLGPDAVFFFRLTERSVVELQIQSDIDTVIAVRKTCDDPLTEVACSNDPLDQSTGAGGRAGSSGGAGAGSGAGGVAGAPGPPLPIAPDAGPTPPQIARDAGPAATSALLLQAVDLVSKNPLDAGLRMQLDPGLYYVIVDQTDAFGVGGSFKIIARSTPPPANASCVTPDTVGNGTTLNNVDLSLASTPPADCGGDAPRPALFYAATIPSGQRLTVHAQSTHGDLQWFPVLQIFASCTETICLATDRPGMMDDRTLQYVNNGPDPLAVIFSVAANAVIKEPRFNLTVRIAAPVLNSTCGNAVQVVDGTTMAEQDIADGADVIPACGPPGKTLFYRATVEPRQTITARLVQRQPVVAPISVSIVPACGLQECLAPVPPGPTWTNTGTSTTNVILQATSPSGAPPGIFDLSVSITPAAVQPLTISPSEAARRLTLLLWGPNATMVNPADVTDVAAVGRTARAMAQSPQAEPQLRKFFRWWLQLQRIADVQINDSALTMDVRAAMALEPEDFGFRTTLASGRFADLILNTTVDVAPALAGIYQAMPGPQVVPLRVGLLTMPGILAMGTAVTRNSPVRRGLFVLNQMLCQQVPPPPPNLVTVVPPPDQWNGRSLREELAMLQSEPTCAGCHQLIDPIGFAYERFDVLGRLRSTDNGKAIDDTGKVNDIPVNGPGGMAMTVAGSDQSRSCFVQKWFEFATEILGRQVDSDGASLIAASTWAAAHDFQIIEVIVGVAMSPGFLAP